MAHNNTAVTYHIRFEKDYASVKTTYDLSVPIGGAALIAGFQVSVEGADLISNFIPGQSRFNGAQFRTLLHPDQDAAVSVSFSISSNEGWTASGTDVLRGGKTHDDAEFSN
jgi:predicted alpha/beta hydrolase family esterase